MKPKHTPGPWIWDYIEKSTIDILGGGKKGSPILIAEIDPEVGAKPKIAEANARLIASAPDLLKALKYFEESFTYMCKKINWGASHLDAKAVTYMNTCGPKARQAIIKAEEG
jgi:hypothetical protein